MRGGSGRREITFLVMLGVCLFGIIFFSKSHFGVDLGFLPRKPLSIGFQETRSADTWAVSFDQLNGKIKNAFITDGETPSFVYLSMKSGSGRVSLRVQSDTTSKDFESLADIIKIPLSQFGGGIIRLTLIGEKASAGDVQVHWGEENSENSGIFGALIQN